MQTEFEVTLELASSPEATFQAITDMSTRRQWLPGYAAHELMQGDGGAGSVFRLTRTVDGTTRSEIFEVKTLTPSTRYTVHLQQPSTASKISEIIFDYTLASAPENTTLHLRGVVIYSDEVPQMMVNLICTMLKGRFQSDWESLKTFLASGDSA